MNRIVIILLTIIGLSCFSSASSFALDMVKQKNVEEKKVRSESEPENYFRNARQGFHSGDFNKASENLKLAAFFIKTEAEAASEDDKVVLLFSVQKIEKIADDIDNNKTVAKHIFNNAIANASYNLSAHYHKKALKSWTKNKSQRAGLELRKSAKYLELAGKWSGTTLKEGTVVTIEESRKLSEKLIKGAGWTTEEVSKRLKAMGEKISAFKIKKKAPEAKQPE